MKNKMKPKILVMGGNQDYHEVEVSWARLREEVSKRIGISEEELLENLRIEDTKISAHQLKNYGATISLTERTLSNETMINGLENFFEKVGRYAEKHKALYVLI